MKQNETRKKDGIQEVIPEQVINLLKFIEENFDESTKEKIFGRLGRECFYSRGLDKWVNSFKSDLESFLDWVNSGKSRYWKKVEYDREKSTIKVISRKSPVCVCAYAQCPDPPKSLCNHCCRLFQKEIFETLLGKEVEVQVDSSTLLDGGSCNTTIIIKS
jgi:hypothetical protein